MNRNLPPEIPSQPAGARLDRLSPAKRALLEQRLRGTASAEPVGRIMRRPAGEPAPLSFAQRRLWFLDQLQPGGHFYNIAESVRLKGHLQMRALERALEEIVRRHEVLRTSFPAVDGEPQVVVSENCSVPLPVIDLQSLSEVEREVQVRRHVMEHIRWGFDLSQGPLMKVKLLRVGEQDHRLLVNLHHIISDGWSSGVFFQELIAAYEAFAVGKASPLPALPIQYSDFSAWQQQSLQGDQFNRQLDYWKKQLSGVVPLQLPLDKPRPAAQTFSGDQQTFVLPSRVVEAIGEICQRESVTLQMFCLAAFKVLLQRYSGQDDLVVGSPITNRTRVETENLIGFFVNTLVLRSDLSGDPTFLEVLRRIRETWLGAFANQDLPFEKVVEALNPERDPSQNPIFQVMFAFQGSSPSTKQLPGLSITRSMLHNRTAPFDLTVFFDETSEGLQVCLEYNTDLFNPATMVRMAGHFEMLVHSILENAELPASKLRILTKRELDDLDLWNCTYTEYPRGKCVHELFAEQVAKTPEAVALIFEDQQMTYRQLDNWSNQVANFLQNQGVEPGAFIGLCLERSIEMVAAMLGVLKAGAAYVPLDPRYPKDRIAYLLADAEVHILLTQQRLISSLPANGQARIVRMDADGDEIHRVSNHPVRAKVSPDGLAYVMYTSGSTGIPKGVCIPHRGIVRLVKNTNYLEFGPDDVFLQFAPAAFDASTFEIWGPLLNGGRIVLYAEHLSSLEDFGETLSRHGVNTLWLTAGLFHQIVEEKIDVLKPIRRLLAGGDVLSVPHVRKVLKEIPGCELINGYGPTECTTFSACCRLTDESQIGDSVPIGRPISNTTIHILDRSLNPVPVGIPGEIYIGGDGLAREYLNSPELTEAKFVADPFSPARGDADPRIPSRSGARLYRSGDLARYLPDGRIEFLGRIDNQVKIRGFRIEPGEIEAVLARHPDLREAMVISGKDSFGNKRLIAYVVPRDIKTFDLGGPRRYAKEQLPDYMVPAAFVALESFPLNPNGKVDRRALPPPEPTAAGESYVAPRNEIEARLASIWSEALGIQRIGVQDNFFELGGHSLLAVRVFSQIKKQLNRYLPLTAIFQAPTIEQIAALLDRSAPGGSWSYLVPIQPEGSRPPIFWVHTLGGGGGGGLFRYKSLAERLGSDQPSYGIQAPPVPFETLEEMARHYIPAIRLVQPHGPYHLGGYCFGGNVAYEIAQQLRMQGEEVAFVGLIESWGFPSRETSFSWKPAALLNFANNFYFWLRDFLSLSPKEMKSRVAKKLARLVRKLTGQLRPELDLQPELDEVMNFPDYPSDFRRHAQVHWKALLRYEPKPYAGPVTLFRVRRQGIFNFDPTLGWGELTGGSVQVRIIPGTHETVFNEPQVDAFAADARRCLDGEPAGK
ncbi:MAG: amino acid adenylation domain-containing protein [Verrucomicrobiae bacterium]|nr:amino acid adenylation domain-containing protein [Verrucomicrobiae bacterium]